MVQFLVMAFFVGEEVYAQSSLPPLYTIDEFFWRDDARAFSISADGESLLILAPADGILNLFRRNIATGEEVQITFEQQRSISNHFLKGDTILFSRDSWGNEIFQIYRVNDDGTTTNLTPFPGVIATVMDTLPDTYEEILIRMNRQNPQRFNIYRLNIYTGEIVSVITEDTAKSDAAILAIGETASIATLLMDSTEAIRILMYQDGSSVIALHRYSEEDEFDLAAIWHIDEFAAMVAFDQNDQNVFAVSNINRNTEAIVLMNPSTIEEIEVLYERDDVDVHSLNVSRGVLRSVQYHTPYRFTRVFFCDYIEGFFRIWEGYFDSRYILSLVSASMDGSRFIVSTSADVSAGGLYLVILDEYDVVYSIEQLVDRNGPINPDHMAPMGFVSYIARDGLTITGYLTLPIGVAPYNLPMVVMPHGGPWVRDTWGWNTNVQFLANRGYAVFQPNFRASTGFGRDFMQAGFRQWGLAIQDDITDGVLWLIEQGIADPDRIGIFGTSFGGYAALAGAAFTPELYAAAVSYVGVSNIFTFMEEIPIWWEFQRELLYERVGHPIRDYEQLVATSPVFHADRITAPLFIAHGANDPRVDLSESLQIVVAMLERDLEVEFFIAWDEGHGFRNFVNIEIFYTVMEAFFAEYLGGRTLVTLDELPRPLFDLSPLFETTVDVPREYAYWVLHILSFLNVNWDYAPVARDVLDYMEWAGVDYKTIGLVLIEDLLTLLDDYDADNRFDDLWGQFMGMWEGWQYEPPLRFVDEMNNPISVPDTSGLLVSEINLAASVVEHVYILLGVNWDAVPVARNILDNMIESGIDHRTIALIMVEDFLEFMDDFDGVVAFPDLWEHILHHNWTVSHQLEFVGR